MQAAKQIVQEDNKNSINFNPGIDLYGSAQNLLVEELDPRDWILTPEIHNAAKKVEASFNLAGNCAGNGIRLTHSLKSFLINLQCSYPSAKIDLIGSSIFQCFTVFITKLSSYPAGRQRAIVAYQLLDQELEISKNKNTTCRKRCAACCHLMKDITNDEADLLASLIRAGVRIDRRLLEKQAAMSSGKNTNRQITKSGARCLFLGRDNLCKIYDFRPLVCRKYIVTSPPEECDKKQGKISQIPLIAEEIVVSAALSCRGNHHGPMSLMISQARKRKNRVGQKAPQLNIIRIPDGSADGSPEIQQLHCSEKFGNDFNKSAEAKIKKHPSLFKK
jgi:Fe-S-cluster containining protein